MNRFSGRVDEKRAEPQLSGSGIRRNQNFVRENRRTPFQKDFLPDAAIAVWGKELDCQRIGSRIQIVRQVEFKHLFGPSRTDPQVVGAGIFIRTDLFSIQIYVRFPGDTPELQKDTTVLP